MDAFDAEHVSRVVTGSLSGPGGVALVINVFANVPGVIHSPMRKSIFRSEPERLQIADWRFEVAKDGRVRAAHVVNGIVIAEESLAAHAVGPHIARALSQLVTNYGSTIVPNIHAAVEALRLGSGGA